MSPVNKYINGSIENRLVYDKVFLTKLRGLLFHRSDNFFKARPKVFPISLTAFSDSLVFAFFTFLFLDFVFILLIEAFLISWSSPRSSRLALAPQAPVIGTEF